MYGRIHSMTAINKMKYRAQNRDPICYEQATLTKIERGIAIPKDLKTAWEFYEETVDNITNRSWMKYKSIINPNNYQRGSDYELDHKYSKIQGFIDKVPPDILGHFSNLEIIPKFDNRSKRTKCNIN